MVYSFRSFIIQTNDSIRQQLITALIQENLSLKQSLLLHDSFNSLKIEFNLLNTFELEELPHTEEQNPFLISYFSLIMFINLKNNNNNKLSEKSVGTGLRLQNLQAAVFTITICFYGLSLSIWRKLISKPIIGNFLQNDYYLWLLQGTIAAFFPETMPFVFFGIYTFAYRVEVIFNTLQTNRKLCKQVINYIQRLRKSRIGMVNFIGRVGAFGFLGGPPKMPGGNPHGMIVWGVVVVSSVALNQYRLYRRDKMLFENERIRNQQQAQNEAYRTHTEAVNKRPWFGNKPPEPPKF
jgi:hypothetical protein